MGEQWTWVDLVPGKPREVDPAYVMDLSMHGRFRFMQIMQWRRESRHFMSQDINGLDGAKLIEQRSKELLKSTLEEGTNVGRRDAGSGDGESREDEDSEEEDQLQRRCYDAR